MNLNPNPGKNLIIEIEGRKWERYPIKTHFINENDSFKAIIEKYVLPFAKPGDIVALGQKIVSIIQKRIILKKDVKVGFWAKFLSKFAKKTPYGFSVGNPLKMQLAINMAGLPRIFLAGLCSIVCKLFGVSGVFYKIAGHQINELDGFYGKFFPQYGEIGLLGPIDCDSLCDKLKKRFGFSFFIADVNDLGGNVLGSSKDLKGKPASNASPARNAVSTAGWRSDAGWEKLLLKILKDNPAGQSDEQTPIILIRQIL